ncbi:winged helix-turn-helix transcriptional regulator [Methanoregula sp.]|uniref:winged helix-turn-helix transcriptional regulator n=1 Tax=Methanoregula sp. TaxID=2052170 RepID=UPI003BAFC513
MKRELWLAGFFFLAIILLAAPTAASGGYSVALAYGSTGTPVPDLVPISFWDLSWQDMAIVMALLLCPICVIPLEILFASKLLAFLGFRRIARRNILEQGTRNEIYQLIVAAPGISFPTLKQCLSLSRGTLTYHVLLLSAQHKIVIHKTHGRTSYFENNGRYDGIEQKILHHLGNEREKRIIDHLISSPGSTRQDLEQVLGVSGPTITWHMKRMLSDGILNIRKDGRYSRYSLTAETAGILSPGRIPGRMPVSGEIPIRVLSGC